MNTDRLVEPQKQNLLKITVAGITIVSSNGTHNAPAEIFVRLLFSSKTIFSNDNVDANANCPIEVTLEGIVISFNPPLYKKRNH